MSESIDRVASLHRDTCDLAHPGTPSATVIVIRETGADLEYLVLADSVLILQEQDKVVAITDDREAQVGLNHRALMDSLPAGSPEHTRAHRAYVEALRSYRNRAGGFWVASIDPAVSQEAIVGTRPLDALDSVVLLSDGASRLVDRFDIATWLDLVDLSKSKGPASLLDWVREAEASDPTGQRWPRGKSSDDATVAYVSEVFSPGWFLKVE